jgi:hypothetical protein
MSRRFSPDVMAPRLSNFSVRLFSVTVHTGPTMREDFIG